MKQMAAEITALLVDVASDDAQSTIRALEPEISISESDFTNSIHKAVISHSEAEFTVCFISDHFPATDLAVFFDDMRRIGKDKSCVFIQVKKDLPPDFDRESVKALGFTTAITRRGTHDDKAAVKLALKGCFHLKEVQKRKVDVRLAMRMMLREIDRTANDHRRGFHHKMMPVAQTGIEMDTEFDPDVLLTYFEHLEKESEVSKPRIVEKLAVPDKVLKRKLPKLTKDGYDGASSRVWEMLAEKHGIKADGQPVRPPAPPPPAENNEEENQEDSAEELALAALEESGEATAEESFEEPDENEPTDEKPTEE